MSQAELQLDKPGHAVVNGSLDFQTVIPLRAKGDQLIAEQDKLVFDCAGVKRSDSAGLALILAWLRSAQQYNKTIRFVNVPQQLVDVAKMSRLESFLIEDAKT